MYPRRLLISCCTLLPIEEKGKRYWNCKLPCIKAHIELSSTFVYDQKMSMKSCCARNAHLSQGGWSPTLGTRKITWLWQVTTESDGMAILRGFVCWAEFCWFKEGKRNNDCTPTRNKESVVFTINLLGKSFRHFAIFRHFVTLCFKHAPSGRAG